MNGAEELFDCPAEGEGSPSLHAALASTYGCDYGFVDDLVRGSPADLARRVAIFDDLEGLHRKVHFCL